MLFFVFSSHELSKETNQSENKLCVKIELKKKGTENQISMRFCHLVEVKIFAKNYEQN